MDDVYVPRSGDIIRLRNQLYEILTCSGITGKAKLRAVRRAPGGTYRPIGEAEWLQLSAISDATLIERPSNG